MPVIYTEDPISACSVVMRWFVILVVSVTVASRVVGLAFVGHHRMVTAAISPVGHLLHTTVGKVDPVAAVHASVAVAFFALSEVGDARRNAVVINVGGGPLWTQGRE